MLGSSNSASPQYRDPQRSGWPIPFSFVNVSSTTLSQAPVQNELRRHDGAAMGRTRSRRRSSCTQVQVAIGGDQIQAGMAMDFANVDAFLARLA
jgi:hypothetical protein